MDSSFTATDLLPDCLLAPTPANDSDLRSILYLLIYPYPYRAMKGPI